MYIYIHAKQKANKNFHQNIPGPIHRLHFVKDVSIRHLRILE